MRLPKHVTGVTSQQPIDGTRQRRRRRTSTRQVQPDLDYHHQAPKALMDEARRRLREGQRLVVVSPSEVYLVNR